MEETSVLLKLDVFLTRHKRLVCLYHLSVTSEQLHVINRTTASCFRHVRGMSDWIFNCRLFVHIFSPLLLWSCFNLFHVLCVEQITS